MSDIPKRRLAAIVAVDVVGYSRLMEADEESALAALKQARLAARPIIKEHGGRTVGTSGDGLLLEYPSVVEAVRSAMKLQAMMTGRAVGQPNDRKMEFRIGINLGDVMIEGDDIFGDGVNIAARVEALSPPGGVCLTAAARDQVRDGLGVEFDDLGEVEVKNISRPIRIFQIRMDGVSAPALRRQRSWRAAAFTGLLALLLLAGAGWWWTHNSATPYAIADTTPSIAVLPFKNRSAGAAEDFYSDGFAEDLITDLSKLRNLLVIARNSSFAYRGESVDVGKVGRELGVKYVLDGSVRRAGSRVRVTAELVDTFTGEQLWSERYDRDDTDVFAVQDEIRRKIVEVLDVKLADGEQALAWRRTTDSTAAYDAFLQARALHENYTAESMHKAVELYKRAIEIDPEFAAAWLRLGWSNFAIVSQGWAESPSTVLADGFANAERALQLDPTLAEAYALKGSLTIAVSSRDNRGPGIALLEKAVAMNPNSAISSAMLALFLPYTGRTDEALAYAEKAMRLNPNPPDWYLLPVARANLYAGRCDKAIDYFRQCVAKLPDAMGCQRDLTAALMSLGRSDEARVHAREIIRIAPDFSLSKYSADKWASVAERKDEPDEKSGTCLMDDARRFLLLYKAGLPE